MNVEDDLRSLPLDLGGPPSGMMNRYLLRQAEETYARWRAEYECRKTPDEIVAYQKRARASVLESFGGLPERTPLNPQITGTIYRPDYRVEKIVFESQPKHYVSALLFLPDQRRFKPPHPGVLVPCGHSGRESKGYPDYQAMAALLAINGMAALVFDPIDQGERRQCNSPAYPAHNLPWEAHCVVGIGSTLLGGNTARFEIWDGMRGIDYLQSRPEVDPQRIGCTGTSGGGTQTSFLMALDDRIRCAAPSCYLTGMPRLLSTHGAGDAEQHFFGQLLFGVDHADLIMMRAPSPVLLCAATHDFFDITGVWDTFRYAKRLYTRMGCAERVDILENDAPHNFDKTQREGVVRWMARWLMREDRVIAEPALSLLNERDYQCTADGSVMSLPAARSVYDLNEDDEDALATRRAAAWANGDRDSLLEHVRRLAGIRKLSELRPPNIQSLGTLVRTGYTIEKLSIGPEEGISLPALWFEPEGLNPHGVALYLHDTGMADAATAGGPIEQLALGGAAVLAVDLRGTGQTQQCNSGAHCSPEYQDVYIAYMLGRSYVGMRAEDVLICARYAAERLVSGGKVTVRLCAVGNVGIPALHAAALEPELFSAVRLSGMLRSWATIIHDRVNEKQVANIVHGALSHYDLPNLEETLGDKLLIERPVNAVGTVISGN